MLQNTWMHACVIQSRVTAALGRAQPRISVLSSSDSMRFVTHATVQSCAAGARMTAADAPGADTSEKRIFACSKGCGRTYTRKYKRKRHSRKCTGPKTCPVPNCSHPDILFVYGLDNLIGYVFEVCANLDRTAEKRNQLPETAPQGDTCKGIQEESKQAATGQS